MTDDEMKKACDTIMEGAVAQMSDLGVPIGMLLDRLFTFGAAQSCGVSGSKFTADMFRFMADRIDAGVFNHLDRTMLRSKH